MLFEKTKPILWFIVRCSWFMVHSKDYLKKQSQFASRQIDVKSYLKGEYEVFNTLRCRKNKANMPTFGLIS